MKKRIVLLASLLLLAGSVARLVLYWYNHRDDGPVVFTAQDYAQVNARLHRNVPAEPTIVPTTPLSPSHHVRLAIGWLGLPGEDQNHQLADVLTAQLTEANGLELVDRQSLDKVLGELALNLSGLVRAKDAVRVGKLLRAEWFLLGSSGKAGNTNSVIVARIVDARTGIMRDVGVFDRAKSVPALAAELAAFVQQCREAASSSHPRTFLAIGTFADVGVNTRQAEFPQQLRAYLIRAYHQEHIALLEREQASTLLDEVRLDLAGLTDDSATNAPQPMQSAFWLVNGFYQSFETDGYEVEVALHVNRAFARGTNFTFRGLPDEALFGRIKQAIDTTLAQASPTIAAPTRWSEALLQMDMGEELLEAGTGGYNPTLGLWSSGPRGAGEQDFTKRRCYLTEAVRALESALLLEPDNAGAKFDLSVCYCDQSVGRYEDGLSYLHALASSPNEDKWSEKARVALGWFYYRTDLHQAIQWFNEAATRSSNPQAAALYRRLAEIARTQAVQAQSAGQGGPQADIQSSAVLEARLFEDVESARSVLNGKGGGISCAYGLEHFGYAFGTNKAAAAKRSLEMLPTLNRKFPDLGPHLLSAVVSLQVDTNSPLIADFRKSLALCTEHPENVLGAASYFENLGCSVYPWCFEHRLYTLAAELLESKREASLRRPEIGFDEKDKIRLAYAYARLERWTNALSLLDGMGDVAIEMHADGPWGPASCPVLSARLAAICRQKLGQAQTAKGGLSTLVDPCLCLHTPAVFATSPDTLWLAIGNQLLQLSFDLRTNKVGILPVSGGADFTALCLGPDRLWIGTAGQGLIEYDKGSGRCRLMTEKDGLLIDYISSLCLQDKTLWIGFGREGDGGLGCMDLPSGHISVFTPPLPANPLGPGSTELVDSPPRHAVTALMAGVPGEVWMHVAGRGFCRYHSTQNTWDQVPGASGTLLASVAVNGAGLVGVFSLPQCRLTIAEEPRPGDTNRVGTTERLVTFEERDRMDADPAMRRRIRGIAIADFPSKTSLRVRPFGERNWRSLDDAVGVPALPNCLLLDGSDLWLGGPGYVGVFDLARNKLRSLCAVPARSVDRIEVGGGYVWAQFENHLHKAPLPASR